MRREDETLHGAHAAGGLGACLLALLSGVGRQADDAARVLPALSAREPWAVSRSGRSTPIDSADRASMAFNPPAPGAIA